MAGVVVRQINAERLVLFGWPRAILLQVAHPLVAAGVADHSHFRSGALAAVARLRGTLRSMLSLAFGDPAAYGRSIAGIKSIHTRVHGELRTTVGVFPAGTPYSAEDPALLLWVHATFVESVLLTYDRIIRRLSVEDRDEYCRLGADVAIALGAIAEHVPRTWAALEAYLEREYESGRIAVGPDARLIADAVLFPPMAAATGPFAWANRIVTLGLLPPAVRDQYRYRWDDRRDKQLARTLGLLRAARRVSPRVLAWWPNARRSSRLADA